MSKYLSFYWSYFTKDETDEHMKLMKELADSVVNGTPNPKHERELLKRICNFKVGKHKKIVKRRRAYFFNVNNKVWNKHELFKAMYYYNSNHGEISLDDIEYALEETYTDNNGILRSKNDNRIVKPSVWDGNCDASDYVHYNPIKTSFKEWPIIASSFNDSQPGTNPLECILYSKKHKNDLVDLTEIRRQANHPSVNKKHINFTKYRLLPNK